MRASTNKTAVIRLLILSAIASAFVSNARAEGVYCAFEVKVSTPSGEPFPDVPAAIVGAGGKEFGSEARTDKNGVVRFCDAPMQRVDIIVGFDRCGAVMIRQVKPPWLRTAHFSVIYARRTCGEFIVPSDCHVLLRVVDEKDRPVIGAHLDTGPGGEPSDVYGRLFRSLKESEKLEGVVTKDGYEPMRISEQCTHEDDHDIEEKVVMRKPQR